MGIQGLLQVRRPHKSLQPCMIPLVPWLSYHTWWLHHLHLLLVSQHLGGAVTQGIDLKEYSGKTVAIDGGSFMHKVTRLDTIITHNSL